MPYIERSQQCQISFSTAQHNIFLQALTNRNQQEQKKGQNNGNNTNLVSYEPIQEKVHNCLFRKFEVQNQDDSNNQDQNNAANNPFVPAHPS